MNPIKFGPRRKVFAVTKWLVLSLGLGMSFPVLAQWTNAIAMRGEVPGAAYDISGIENVNMLNGNVSLKIPITSLPQGHGGSGIGVSLNYNSDLFDEVHAKATDAFGAQYNSDKLFGGVAAGWRLGYFYSVFPENQPADGSGSGTCEIVVGGSNPAPSHTLLFPTRMRALFPDGSVHILYPVTAGMGEDTSSGGGWTEYDPGGNPNSCAQSQGTVATLTGPITFATRDSTYVRAVFYPIDSVSGAADPSWFNRAWIMYFPDGSRVQGGGTVNFQEIIDRNANSVRITTTDPCSPNPACPVTVISDSFNSSSRSITITHNLPDATHPNPTDSITQAGYNNLGLTWTLTWGYASSGFSYQCGDSVADSQANTCSLSPYPVVTQLSISGFTDGSSPINLSYGFGYNAGAADPHLTDISLPWGASVKYQYSIANPPVGTFGDLMDDPLYKKTVTHQDPQTGTALNDVWQYGIVFNSHSSTVQNPDSSITTYRYTDVFSGGATAVFTYEIDHPDGSREENLWAANLTTNLGIQLGNPVLQAEIRSVGSGGAPVNSSFKYSTYDFNGNVLQTERVRLVRGYCGLTCFTSGNPLRPSAVLPWQGLQRKPTGWKRPSPRINTIPQVLSARARMRVC